jgi:hypothetical protein
VFLGEASLWGRRCRLSNKVAAEVLVFIKDCRALVWGVVFIITLLAGFVLVFRWRSLRYWKIAIRVDSLWKIGTKLQGSPVWSLSCGIRLLGLSLRVFLADWSADCSSYKQLSDCRDWSRSAVEVFRLDCPSSQIRSKGIEKRQKKIGDCLDPIETTGKSSRWRNTVASIARSQSPSAGRYSLADCCKSRDNKNEEKVAVARARAEDVWPLVPRSADRSRLPGAPHGRTLRPAQRLMRAARLEFPWIAELLTGRPS